MRLLFSLLISLGLLWANEASAACTGSGLAWSCPAGSSMADISSAYGSGTDGMVITLQPGAYSWTTTLTLLPSKGVTLICAATPPTSAPWGANESSGCNVSTTARVLSGFSDYNTPRGNIDRLYRLSGFNFTNVTADRIVNLICTCTFKKVRVDHNSFSGTNTPDKVLYFGGGDQTANIQYINGVVDHNKLRGQYSYWLVDGNTGSDATTFPTEQRGTGNNLFMENNDILFTARQGDMNCLDWQGTGGLVFRFNTLVNCRTILHGVLHGGGPSNWEVYGNTYTLNSNIPADSCYGCINHQGSGEMYAWSNGFVATQPLSGALRVQHYRSSTNGSNPSTTCDGDQTNPKDGNRSPTASYYGYPCWRQPGRNFAGVMRPIYAWGNYNSSTQAKVDLDAASNNGSPDYFSYHLKLNRDYYNAVSASAQSSPSSPFTGASGIGFGTLANRPTTCTTTSEAADQGNGGVGYWATNAGGNWNTSNTTADDGALFVCTATNTWTQWYTPYTYPHPLVGSAVSNTPAAPTNLKAL